jgi:hypothetical protein
MFEEEGEEVFLEVRALALWLDAFEGESLRARPGAWGGERNGMVPLGFSIVR